MRKKSNLIAIAVAMSLVGSSTVMAATNVQAGEKTQTEEVQNEVSKDATADGNKEESTEEISKEESTVNPTEESTEAEQKEEVGTTESTEETEQEILPDETKPSAEEGLEEKLPEKEEKPEESQTESSEDMAEEKPETEVPENTMGNDSVNSEETNESEITEAAQEVQEKTFDEILKAAIKKGSDTINLSEYGDQTSFELNENITIPAGCSITLNMREGDVISGNAEIDVKGTFRLENRLSELLDIPKFAPSITVSGNGNLLVGNVIIDSLEVNGGKAYIKASNKAFDGNYGLRNLTVNGGMCSLESDLIDSSAEININGGELRANRRNAGLDTINVKGGSLYLRVKQLENLNISSGKVLVNSGVIKNIKLDQNSNGDKAELKIEGGTFEEGSLISITSNASEDKHSNIKFIISGGIFKGAIENTLTKHYIYGGVFAEDVDPEDIATGYKSVYKDLTESGGVKGYYILKTENKFSVSVDNSNEILVYSGFDLIFDGQNITTPLWKVNIPIDGDDTLPDIEIVGTNDTSRISTNFIDAFNAEKYVLDNNISKDSDSRIGISGIYTYPLGGELCKTGNKVTLKSILFGYSLFGDCYIGSQHQEELPIIKNEYLTKEFSFDIVIPETIIHKTVKVKHNGKTQVCTVKENSELGKYITVKTDGLTETDFSEVDFETLKPEDLNKAELFEIILEEDVTEPKPEPQPQPKPEPQPQPSPNPGGSGSTGGSSSSGGSSGGGSGLGSAVGHGYGSSSSNLNSGSNAGSPSLPAISGEKNSVGQTVIGNTAVAFLADKNAAVAGLPEQTVNQINGINSGAKLADIIKDVDLNGFTALNGTQAFIMRDTLGNVKTALTPISLQVPSLVTGLNNVQILFYNNATGKWEVIVPTAVDFNGKVVTANLPGSGTLTIIYK